MEHPAKSEGLLLKSEASANSAVLSSKSQYSPTVNNVPPTPTHNLNLTNHDPLTPLKLKPNEDPTKKLFRHFLKKSGLKDAILRSIVALYEEDVKPDQPIGFMSRLLGYGIPNEEQIGKYEARVERLRQKIERAKEENIILREMYETKRLEQQHLRDLQQKCQEKELKIKESRARRAVIKAKEDRIRRRAQQAKLHRQNQYYGSGGGGGEVTKMFDNQRHFHYDHPPEDKQQHEPVMKIKVPTLLTHKTHFGPVPESSKKAQQQQPESPSKAEAALGRQSIQRRLSTNFANVTTTKQNESSTEPRLLRPTSGNQHRPGSLHHKRQFSAGSSVKSTLSKKKIGDS